MKRTYVRYPEEFKEKVIKLILDGHKSIGEISKEYNIARSTVDIWCKNKCIKNNRVSIDIDCSDIKPNFNYEIPDHSIDIKLKSEDENLLKKIKITPTSLDELVSNSSKCITTEDEVDILIKAIHIITNRLKK